MRLSIVQLTSILCCCAVCWIVILEPTFAQPFNTIMNIPPDPNLGNGQNAFNAQVNLFDGGEIGHNFFAAFDSQVNVAGGSVGGNFNATDIEVNISGGTIGAGFTASEGLVDVSGGSLSDNFTLDSAEAIISGGSFGSFDVSSGDVNTFNANSSTIDVSNGSFGLVYASSSEMNIAGGTFGLVSASNSSVSMSGGYISLLNAADSSINITGGSFGNVFSFDSSIDLSGRQFVLDGVDITSSLSLNEPTPISERDVTLSGRLADGSPFSFNLNSELGEDVFDTATELRVLRLARLPGDYNFNGEVDAPDYNIWRDTFGSNTELAADGNDNGVIDAPDYNVWRNNFGQAVGTAAPEPSSIVLQLLTLFWLLVRFGPVTR